MWIMSTTPTGGLPGPPPTATPTSGAQKRQRKDIARIVAALIIVIVLVAFVVKNSEKVNVSFVFFSASVRLIWVLLVTAILGALADRLLLWRRRKNRRERAGRD
jgi:uncharacterized integral membrane protein